MPDKSGQAATTGARGGTSPPARESGRSAAPRAPEAADPQRRRLSIGLLGAAAFGRVAPAFAQDRPGAPAQASGSAATLVQRFGNPPPRPARLFAAGPPAGVLLACLAPERLLGWPMRVADAARELLAPALRDRPVLGRLAGRGSTVGLETLLALKPDLIVDAGTVDETYRSAASRVHGQTGVPYALVDGRLADSAAQLRQVGQLLGAQDRGEALAAFADEALADAARVRAAGTAVPTIYLARGADGLETASVGAINAEIIDAAGGRNVAVTGRAGVARVSMEQVLGWAPDWVVTQDRNFHRHARTDAVWRALPAVREGRLLLAPDLPFGWLDGPPSVNRLIGVKWLAAQLRSGSRTAAEALRETVDDARRFHALFYGVTPSRETVQGWLDGRG